MINVTAISLRRSMNSPFAQMAQDWTEALNEERDDECGPLFWKWMTDHQQDVDICMVCDTFFYINEAGKIVGTASIVGDDRDVGKNNAISGIWLGGLNVDHKYRGNGIARHIIVDIDNRLKNHVIENGDISLNLFSNKEMPLRLYKNFGFVSPIEIFQDGRHQVVLKKEYNIDTYKIGSSEIDR